MDSLTARGLRGHSFVSDRTDVLGDRMDGGEALMLIEDWDTSTSS